MEYLPLLGIRLIEANSMVDRIQNRTHRKKRINKKWAKNYGFTNTPKLDVYQMGDTIICHPTVAQKIREAL